MTLGEFKAFVEGVMAAGTTDSAALKLILEKLKTVTAPAHLGGMFTEPPRPRTARDYYQGVGIGRGSVDVYEDPISKPIVTCVTGGVGVTHGG